MTLGFSSFRGSFFTHTRACVLPVHFRRNFGETGAPFAGLLSGFRPLNLGPSAPSRLYILHGRLNVVGNSFLSLTLIKFHGGGAGGGFQNSFREAELERVRTLTRANEIGQIPAISKFLPYPFVQSRFAASITQFFVFVVCHVVRSRVIQIQQIEDLTDGEGSCGIAAEFATCS